MLSLRLKSYARRWHVRRSVACFIRVNARSLSNGTAAAGETHGAGTEDNQGQHYLALVPMGGLLWELDGRNIDDDGVAFPFCHGATSESTFLADAAAVVQDQFIKRDPSNPNFSMLALAKLDET